jgi:iron-sulfur cluster repair protein YtfE (RIC family)
MRFTGNSDGATRDATAPASPVEMLRACHAQTRHFVQLSRTLAEAVLVPPAEIAEAASDVFRYFNHALPLHQADENQSLFPRIQSCLPPGALLREAAETMVEQHLAIDELVAELLPLCDCLRHQPERFPSLAHRLQHVTAALGQIFAAHFHLEEAVIFPALPRLLTETQMQEIAHEMHQRRRPSVGTIHLVQ